MNRLALVAAALAIALPGAAQETPAFPPLPPPRDPSGFGAHIQRTMTLLASSTPQKRNKVKILFYGQSITEQNWWKLVSEDLRRRFPYADLETVNKAVGGFASQILCRVAEHDILETYPDLVIFHVYGDHNRYEDILKMIRTRTTAEILMQLDHVTKWPVDHPDQKDPMWWDYMMNQVFLPAHAKKYGCGLVDVRSQWMDYLKAHKLEPAALLKDGVHLNDHGCFVMAGILNRYLVPQPSSAADASSGAVRTLSVGKEVAWKDGRISLPFEGNRVDLLAAPGASGTARILIDGRKPSSYPECIAFTRTSLSQTNWGPALLRVTSERPREVETWTLKVLEVDEAASHLRFSVSGSRTGPDGEGQSSERFVSKSGRVVIEPEDWWIKRIQEITKTRVPVGFLITWKAVGHFCDTFETPRIEDPSRETAVTVAEGLPNGPHTLEISGPAGICAIRTYQPPLK